MESEAALRRSRTLALLGFLLLATSLLLPWWVLSDHEGGRVTGRDAIHLLSRSVDVHRWATLLTAVLAGVPVLLLFVRLAAASHLHESASWRRDLGVAAGLAGAAVLSTLFWPATVPAFWGGWDYAYGDDPDAVTHETALPGIGWFLAVAATGLVGWGAWTARTRPPPPPATEK
ncbi:MAG TPA: hypothetical protein VI796_05135 [Candidatus Thermoplasmatota archaeon]|nr:hypothetical protein [Candidatus Thermoplasmatota archaeon]